MRRCSCGMTIVLAIAMATVFSVAYAQEKASAPVKKIAIRAGHLIDGRNDKVIDNALILIEGDTITSVSAGGQPPAGVEVLDRPWRPEWSALENRFFERLSLCNPDLNHARPPAPRKSERTTKIGKIT